jgi:hypothetical protein
MNPLDHAIREMFNAMAKASLEAHRTGFVTRKTLARVSKTTSDVHMVVLTLGIENLDVTNHVPAPE